MDALESIKESKRDILHLNRQPSPLQNVLDADRITDYPRRTSPSTSLLSLSSRRSSLSAVSQSSFTSDSSFENGRRPGKKILKNPLQPPRRSKNRVRWKLPNNSSDSLSVDSFESVGSNIYDRARSGVVMATQNWREFEQSPPRGSTGITPMKPPLSKMRTSLSTGTLQTHQYTSPYRGLTTIPQGAVISSLGVKSNETPSPLTYNTSSNNSVSPGGVLSSTPLRHTQSTSAIDFHKQMQLRRGSPNVAGVPILRLDSSNLTDLEESTLEDRKRMHIYQFPQTRSPGTTLQSPDTSRSKPSSQSLTAALLDDDDANDYDHLSPLRGNKGGTDQPSGNKVITSLLHGNKVGTGHPSLLHGNKVGTGHPSLLHGNKVGTGHPSLLHGNKVSTDHPSLLHGNKVGTDHPSLLHGNKVGTDHPSLLHGNKVGTDHPSLLHGNKVGTDHPSLLHGNKVRTQEQQKKDDTDIYSNQDIDDALEVIAKESSGGSTGSHGSSPAEELPPTLPPKKFHRGRNVTIGLESSGNSTSVQPTPGTSSALSFQTQRQSFAHSVTSPQSSSARHASSRSPQVPPPVPPKTRRRKQETNAPTSSHSAQIPYLQKQQQENHKTPENTSRSPSFGERQAAVIKTSPSQSQGSAEEDLMSGVSSTTLVDQEDATTSKSSKSSTTHAPSEYHKQPWSVPGLKERVVVGAEDPGPPIDKLIRTSTDQFPTMTAWNFTSHDPRQPTQHDRQQKFHDPTLSFSVSHSQPDPGSMDFMMPYPTYNQQQVHSQQVRRAPEDKLTVAPTTKRYKLSLDNAFTEGNIMQPVQLSQPVRSTGERSARNQSTHRAQQRGIPRSNSVGQTSRMPTSADIKWSPEEAQVRQRFYSGGKLPMEKPVHHVKDQSVAQLLKDLNINDTGRAGWSRRATNAV